MRSSLQVYKAAHSHCLVWMGFNFIIPRREKRHLLNGFK